MEDLGGVPAPGERFLAARLRRAARNNPNLGPEARGFAAAMDMIDRIPQLLPCNFQQRVVVLPPGWEATGRMLASLYLFAAASFTASGSVADLSATSSSCMLSYGQTYFAWADLSAEALAASIAAGRDGRAARSAQHGVAAQALHLLGCALHTVRADMARSGPVAAVCRLSLAVQLISGSDQRQQECQQQLERLAAKHSLPPLTAAQLLITLHRYIAYICVDTAQLLQHWDMQSAFGMTRPLPPWLVQAGVQEQGGIAAASSQLVQQLRRSGAASSAALLALDPDSAQTHHWLAAMALLFFNWADAESHFECGLWLARQAGDRLWITKNAACHAAALVLSRSMTSSSAQSTTAILGQAQALHREAQEVLESCRHTIPEMWVHELDTTLTLTGQRVYSAAAASASQQSEGNLFVSIFQRLMGGQAGPQVLEQPPIAPVCSGCSRAAVGLRRCAGCNLDQYCSKECQQAAWPSHKAECRARAAAGAGGSAGSGAGGATSPTASAAGSSPAGGLAGGPATPPPATRGTLQAAVGISVGTIGQVRRAVADAPSDRTSARTTAGSQPAQSARMPTSRSSVAHTAASSAGQEYAGHALHVAPSSACTDLPAMGGLRQAWRRFWDFLAVLVFLFRWLRST